MPNYIKGFTVNGEDYKYDYNQIGNKPFGNEAIDVFLPMQTNIPFELVEYYYYYLADPILSYNKLNAGEKYIVNWDGRDYEVEAVWGTEDGQTAIGNKYLFYSSDDYCYDNYPFLIFCEPLNDLSVSDEFPVYRLLVYTTDEGATHSFSIRHKYFTQISSNYLPSYLNMDNKEEVYIRESSGDTNEYTSTITIYGTDFTMYCVNPSPKPFVGYPTLNDKYIVTINGVNHEAVCIRGASEYALVPLRQVGDGPDFVVALSFYGGRFNPSGSLYLKSPASNVTWSVKHITHNVLPMSYMPIFWDNSSYRARSLIEILNYFDDPTQETQRFSEYHDYQVYD